MAAHKLINFGTRNIQSLVMAVSNSSLGREMAQNIITVLFQSVSVFHTVNTFCFYECP